MTEDKRRNDKFLNTGKKKLFSTFRFETQFKITEFLGPLSISLPIFTFRNKIICLKTKTFSGIMKQKQNENKKNQPQRRAFDC